MQPGGAPSGQGVGNDAPPPTDNTAKKVLDAIGLVVAPTTLVTSLLFYFGWARTHAYWGYFGIHENLLGFSSQDYILRAVDSVFVPMALLIGAGLVFLTVHSQVRSWLMASTHKKWLKGGAGTLLWIGFVLGLIGLVGLFPVVIRWSPVRSPWSWVVLGGTCALLAGRVLLRRRWRSPYWVSKLLLWVIPLAGGVGAYIGIRGILPARPPNLFVYHVMNWAPVAAALSIAFVSYALYIRHRLDGRSPVVEARWMRNTRVGLTLGLVVFTLFWGFSVFAEIIGHHRARRTARNLDEQAVAVLFSKEQLHIDAPGVKERSIKGAEEGYRFRYSGLRMLIESNDTYFLLSEAWTPEDGEAVIVPKSLVRVQLSPGTGGS